MYAVGLGLGGFTPPGIPTGYAPSTPIPFFPSEEGVEFAYLATAPLSTSYGTTTTVHTSVEPEWVGLIPGFVGLYQINVPVPPLPSQVNRCVDYNGTSENAIVMLPLLATNTVYICVQP